MAYRGALAGNAPEPEDAAQNVILKALPDLNHPPVYFYVAGRNEAHSQQRASQNARLEEMVAPAHTGWRPPLLLIAYILQAVTPRELHYAIKYTTERSSKVTNRSWNRRRRTRVHRIRQRIKEVLQWVSL